MSYTGRFSSEYVQLFSAFSVIVSIFEFSANISTDILSGRLFALLSSSVHILFISMLVLSSGTENVFVIVVPDIDLI